MNIDVCSSYLVQKDSLLFICKYCNKKLGVLMSDFLNVASESYSLPHLNLVKTYLPSFMLNKHLSVLLLLWLENDVAPLVNYVTFINERICKKVGCVYVFVVITSARSYLQSLKNSFH